MTEETSTGRSGSMPHVGRNVRALRLPRADTLVRLSAALGVTPNDILLRTKQERGR